MAGGTIHWRAFKDTIDMTTCTINCSVLSIEMEGKFRMIHHRRLPAIRRMTGCTQRSKLSIMSIILDMTGDAIHWRTFENAIDVATFAGNSRVPAIEMECEFRMIDIGRLPAGRGMARCAVGSKLPLVRIIIGMAGSTIHWRAFENTIDMATFAGNSRVLAIKLEGELRMIDIGRLPAGRGMARRTIGSKLTLVRIIIGMAGGAVHWGAFEDAIDMATLAGNRGMFSIKLECEFRMIDIGGFPAG